MHPATLGPWLMLQTSMFCSRAGAAVGTPKPAAVIAHDEATQIESLEVEELATSHKTS